MTSRIAFLAAVLTAAAFVWTLLVAAAPTAVGGRAPFIAAAAYRLGSLICHQRAERSFHVGGTQMPVCARCFGLYAGGAAGMGLAWIVRRRWSTRTVRGSLLAGAAPIAVTVALEWLGAIETSNLVRWFTGLPLGLAAGFVIVGLLRGPD